MRKIFGLEFFEITMHAMERMRERNISLDDLERCLLTGEIIAGIKAKTEEVEFLDFEKAA